MHKKNGPVQFERNGEHIKHAKDFASYLYDVKGPKGSKALHLCWEEEDLTLGDFKWSDFDHEDTTLTSEQATKQKGVEMKAKKEEVKVKKEGVKVKKEIKEPINKSKKIKKEPETDVKARVKREESVDSPVRSFPSQCNDQS